MSGFEILGLSPTASDAEIKAAYLRLARQYHPDRFAGTPYEAAAQEQMRRLNAAYDYVLNTRARPKKPPAVIRVRRRESLADRIIKSFFY